jgi:hypothetical protein
VAEEGSVGHHELDEEQLRPDGPPDRQQEAKVVLPLPGIMVIVGIQHLQQVATPVLHDIRLF